MASHIRKPRPFLMASLAFRPPLTVVVDDARFAIARSSHEVLDDRGGLRRMPRGEMLVRSIRSDWQRPRMESHG